MNNRSVQGLRNFRGMTIEDLSKSSGVSVARIEEIEAKALEPTFGEAGDLAIALHATERLMLGSKPYDEEAEDFEEIRTTLFEIGGEHDFDLVISWPGLPSRRYPVSDLSRDLMQSDENADDLAFFNIKTLDNRWLLLSKAHRHRIEFTEPGARSDLPVGTPFSIGLVEGIKDILQDLEPNGTRSAAYLASVKKLLTSFPEADDLDERFLLDTAVHADGSVEGIDVDDRIGALADFASQLQAEDDLVFDFDDGWGEQEVDLDDVLLIDLPLHVYLDEQIDWIEA